MTATPAEAGLDLRLVPIDELLESPWNPRRHFDPAALAELASSLKSQGQITPIVARPKGDRLEIAAGHRRYRAAKLAGLGELLVRVVELDDVAFLEVLNIENLQRDDLHPLEEAQGYRQLMEKAGYDVAKISAKVGKSEKYVYDRIKLLQLSPQARKLFLEERITAGHAIILARLTADEQKRTIGELNRERWDRCDGGLFQPDWGADEDGDDRGGERPIDQVKPRSVRELQRWIDDHIRTRPEAIDPVLFPETVEALEEAKVEDVKVVHITYDFRVTDSAKDPKVRTYGEYSWKRADGIEKSKACDQSVLGLVVAGPRRNEAFQVCVAKKTCKVHWAAEQRQAKRVGSLRNHTDDNSGDDGLARERQLREEEDRQRERWKKARPALVANLFEALKDTPIHPSSPLWGLLVKRVGYAARNFPKLKPANDAAGLVRYLACLLIADDELDGWRPWQSAPKALKAFGVDAVAIVDQIAPTPAPKKPASAAPKKVNKR